MTNVIQIPTALNLSTRIERPRQNWVLSPVQDALFIIVAPFIVLGLALLAFHFYGVAEATALIVVSHIVMTVAHHLPTFIRIYGDTELFKRFKWSFVLGPVVPLTISIAVLAYIHAHDYPVEYFLYLYIVLVLWDPWHFLRQHYGFMRIYDRHNAAPKVIAARMDLWLSVAWFGYIMLASGTWLPELLHDLYASANMPVALSTSAKAIRAATNVMQGVAFAMTGVYVGYLWWCRKRGYFISAAKVALLAITFAAMYLAYTPNAWMQTLAPGWTFKAGFAVIGIVHMTQYLAIVWRYNRTLAKQGERARGGWFRRWHAKGGIALAVLYVAVCLFYGEIVTTRRESEWWMSILLTVGFTSTLMHYYFDGFIWKLRHKENREGLAMTSFEDEAGKHQNHASWWRSTTAKPATNMLARQLLYFGLPMTILSIGAFAAWEHPNGSYVQSMYRAQALSQQGLPQQAETTARSAYAEMNRQLPFATKIVELAPTAAREAELAFLIYNQSLYEHIVMPQLGGARPDAKHLQSHQENIDNAILFLSRSIARNAELGHPGREQLRRDDASTVLASWRKQLAM
jgi:hypothetical protein